MEVPEITAKMAKAVVVVDVEALKPYEKNAKTHSDAQIDELVSLIQEFGFTQPILVDAHKGIIAGHGRLMAAKKLGLASVPIIELTHLTPTQKRAYIIADNKIAEKSGWDFDVLSEELTDLNDLDFNLELTGFEEAELGDLLADDVAGAPADNLSHGSAPSQKETLEKYLANDMRVIQMGFSTAIYDAIAAMLSSVTSQENLKNNSEALQFLLENYHGEKISEWMSSNSNP